MEQYYRLFTSYRYPGLNKDKQVTRDLSEVAQNAHCIVACHDQVRFPLNQIHLSLLSYLKVVKNENTLFQTENKEISEASVVTCPSLSLTSADYLSSSVILGISSQGNLGQSHRSTLVEIWFLL